MNSRTKDAGGSHAVYSATASATRLSTATSSDPPALDPWFARNDLDRIHCHAALAFPVAATAAAKTTAGTKTWPTSTTLR